MSPNRFLILFLLPLLAACPAKSKSPLLFLGEMSASAILPTDWVQDAYLKASNAGAGDHFGYSAVAVSGAIVVVGANFEGNSSTVINNIDNAYIIDSGTSTQSGAAYVFRQDANGNWVQDAYLKASNAGNNDQFSAVAVSNHSIVVGAAGEDNSSTTINNADNSAISDAGTAMESGAVYVFKKDGSGNWLQDAYLKASNAGDADYFGYSVATADNTIVVGAYQEDNSSTVINNEDNMAIIDASTATNSGAVYVFKKDGSGNWLQDAYLKASNAGDADYFGYSVATADNTIVVGAYQEDNSSTVINNDDNMAIIDASTATDSGAAYVFKKDGSGNWLQDAYLKASNAGDADYFGYSVAIADNIIVVGACQEDNSSTVINNEDNMAIIDASTATDSGAAYVFKRDGSGNRLQDAYLKASNAGSGDYFGRKVSIAYNLIAVGAPYEDNISTTIINTDSATPIDDGTADASGAVYLFKKDSSGNWYQDAYVKASNAGAGDSFGSSVAASGDTLIVGTWQEDNSSTFITNDDNATIIDEGTATQSGAAYIFTLK